VDTCTVAFHNNWVAGNTLVVDRHNLHHLNRLHNIVVFVFVYNYEEMVDSMDIGAVDMDMVMVGP
tara:strand:+ start:880 stop:1074 length:195 start_codon:yes stop_codon:yes gene_type:complete